jgi:hypothetical protein
MCCRNSLVFNCDREHAEDSIDAGFSRPLYNVRSVQRSQTIPDSSKSIFQVDRIQSVAWSEFPIGVRKFFRYASSVASERSDPRIGPGTLFGLTGFNQELGEFRIGLRTLFRYASSVANEPSDPRIGPETFFRLEIVGEGGEQRRDVSRKIVPIDFNASRTEVDAAIGLRTFFG